MSDVVSDRVSEACGGTCSARAEGSGRLDRLTELVKWYRFERLLSGLRSEGPGRPGYLPLGDVKPALQSFTGLSDAELEEALGDGCRRRLYALAWRTSSDTTTLCRFATDLIETGRAGEAVRRTGPPVGQSWVILKRDNLDPP